MWDPVPCELKLPLTQSRGGAEKQPQRGVVRGLPGEVLAARDGQVTLAAYRGGMEPNEISGQVVDAALKVHRALGPGLLESVYRACLEYELRSRGLRVRSEIPMPVLYGGVRIDAGYRIDLLVEETVVVESKAVERMIPVHEYQTLTYLRLSGFHLALLINFNVPQLRNGIRRIVNNL